MSPQVIDPKALAQRQTLQPHACLSMLRAPFNPKGRGHTPRYSLPHRAKPYQSGRL